MRKPKGCTGCPLENIGVGFVPPTVVGKTCSPQKLHHIKLGICGEAPAMDELEQQKPFVGKAGQVLRQWVFGNAGVDIDECLIDNTIRCVQPGNEMPGVEILRKAQEHCRQYDVWEHMNDGKGPEYDLLTFHPAALLRDCVPLPLVVNDVGKARRMVEEGKSVRILLGKTAFEKYQPYAQSVGKWRGHVEECTVGKETKERQ